MQHQILLHFNTAGVCLHYLLPAAARRASATCSGICIQASKETNIANTKQNACTCAGLADYPAGPSSPPSQATHPLQDPNLPGSSHMAESQGAGLTDVTQLHAPVVVLDEDPSALDGSHSGIHLFATDVLLTVQSMAEYGMKDVKTASASATTSQN